MVSPGKTGSRKAQVGYGWRSNNRVSLEEEMTIPSRKKQMITFNSLNAYLYNSLMYPKETIRELHLYLQFIDPSIFCPSVPPRQLRAHVIVYIIMLSPLKIHYLLSLIAFYSSGKTPSLDEPNFLPSAPAPV